MPDRDSLSTKLLQAHVDRLVSKQLGTLKNEFPIDKLDSDVFDAAALFLEMMENGCLRFFDEMRRRIAEEKRSRIQENTK